MARPGLEPGTPRFSGSPRGPILRRGTPANSALSSLVRLHCDALGFVRFRADFGTPRAPRSPNRQRPLSDNCAVPAASLCDARVPDEDRASVARCRCYCYDVRGGRSTGFTTACSDGSATVGEVVRSLDTFARLDSCIRCLVPTADPCRHAREAAVLPEQAGAVSHRRGYPLRRRRQEAAQCELAGPSGA
jgi:hypothetical protein